VGGADLALAAATILVVMLVGWLILGRRRQPTTTVRWVLLAVTGGMLAYILYALRLFRPEAWGILPEAAWISSLALVVLVALGGLLALAVVLLTAPDSGR
jgi:NADH:ubiquinone oxidoreductase subunit 4 (subunit M)